MKKIICLIIAIIAILTLVACGNKDMWDTVYTFNYGYIYTPGGELLAEGKVTSWTDYEDGDQLQVTIDGNVYLSSANNIILVKK